METFALTKPLVDNPDFPSDRQQALQDLGTIAIDVPIQHIVSGFSRLSCCYTLQSCYGHFVYDKQPKNSNIEPLPASDTGRLTYRIAYIAICIENSPQGRNLLSRLSELPRIDVEYIQFGSPEWFWDQQPNSYALQVEPARYMDQDKIIIDYSEALHVQDVRNRFFSGLEDLLLSLTSESGLA